MPFKKNETKETKETKKNNTTVLEGENVKITIRTWSDGKKEVQFASVMIADEIIINDCRIAQTKDGKNFLALPQKKDKNGEYRYIVYISKGSISEEIDTLLNGEDMQF